MKEREARPPATRPTPPARLLHASRALAWQLPAPAEPWPASPAARWPCISAFCRVGRSPTPSRRRSDRAWTFKRAPPRRKARCHAWEAVQRERGQHRVELRALAEIESGRKSRTSASSQIVPYGAPRVSPKDAAASTPPRERDRNRHKGAMLANVSGRVRACTSRA